MVRKRKATRALAAVLFSAAPRAVAWLLRLR